MMLRCVLWQSVVLNLIFDIFLRAACYMMVHDPAKALVDCQVSPIAFSNMAYTGLTYGTGSAVDRMKMWRYSILLLGIHLFFHGKFQEAIRRDPSNVKALFREAKCHISLGDATAALRSFGKVKAIEPQHPDLPKEVRQAEQLQHLITEGDKVSI